MDMAGILAALPWSQIGLAGIPLLLLIAVFWMLITGRLYTVGMVEKLIANRDAIIARQDLALEKAQQLADKQNDQIQKLIRERDPILSKSDPPEVENP